MFKSKSEVNESWREVVLCEAEDFTTRYQEESMNMQLLFRGSFKVSTLELKELQGCGAISISDRKDRNQFSVIGMNLHPF